MIRNYLLVYLFALTRCLLATAQGHTDTPQASSAKVLPKKPLTAAQQHSLLKERFRQVVQEKQQWQYQTTTLQKISLAQHDSLVSQQTLIDTLTSRIGQLTRQTSQLQAAVTQQTADLKAASANIDHLEYDKKILGDNQVFRVYHVPAAEVRQQFMQSLAAPESGFQYDDDLVDDEIQITRHFNDQAEAWWVSDKSFDTILELKVRIKPHRYDPQRALVFGEARLLQKARYSNKPFEEQRDREKTDLYRQKTLRLLEGKLNGTSDK